MTDTYNASQSERITINTIILVSLAAMIYACIATENPSLLHPILLALIYTCLRIIHSFMYNIETKMLASRQEKPISIWFKIIVLGVGTVIMGIVIPEKELLLFFVPPMWTAAAVHIKQDIFQN